MVSINYEYNPDVDMSGYVPLSKRVEGFEFVPVSVVEEEAWRSYSACEQNLVEPVAVDDFSFYAQNASLSLKIESERVRDDGVFGNLELVGRGQVTNSRCGIFTGYHGCLRIELHHNSLAGNFEGKVVVHPSFHSCNNFRCPICYKYGASSREARKITQRLAEASKRLIAQCCNGVKEHLILGIPISDYGLGYEVLHKKALKILCARGIIGGVLIFHAFRYHSFRDFKRAGSPVGFPMGWFFSPHWHVLGFLKGGYTCCRNCRKVKDSAYGKPCEATCKGCSGFEAVTRLQNKTDGYICKVADDGKKRITIGGTAWYQLNHATLRRDSVGSHVCTYFGVASYRMLKVEYVKEKVVCPVCQHDLELVRYFGEKVFCLDRNSPLFRSFIYTPMNEGKGDVWVVAGKRDFG